VIYAKTITTEANTSEGSKEDIVLTVTSGLIWLLEIDFPPGCCALQHVQIFDGSYQVLPATPGESLHGDAVTMRFDDLYFKQAAPYELKIRTWNLDDTWSHTIQIRIGMAASRAEMSRYIPAFGWENFERVLAESLASQQAIREKQLKQMLKDLNT